MNEITLFHAVRQLAQVMKELDDDDLGREWTWQVHSEGARFALIGTSHELRDLAATLTYNRTATRNPITPAQYILAQYHAAFRDLQALLIGINDDELERLPAEGEWPLRTILAHIIGAERTFFTLITNGVEQQRAGQEPPKLSGDRIKALVGPREPFVAMMESEGLDSIMEYYAELHGRILVDFSNLTEEDLTAGSIFWEGEPLPARFRLLRFEAHLRQHAIQAEKTLIAIGRAPNEAKMWIRVVFNALAEVEGAIIGAVDLDIAKRNEVAAVISARAEEMAGLFKA